MTVFDAATVALSGLNVIEASAGTGKTYTLAELYLRLVVEKGLTVDQILVVTYTRAATEELRDRLRARLAEERDRLLQQPEYDAISGRRLNLAIQSFDESAIFTIHGFCQRVLSDFAFESGLAFDMTLVGDDQSLLLNVIDDFWRQHVSSSDARLARYIIQSGETPDTLLASIQPLLGKPYLQFLPIAKVDLRQLEQQAQTQFDRVKQLWQQEQEQVIATLRDKSLLNGNKYREKSVETCLKELHRLLSEETVPDELFKEFERLTSRKLTDALKAKKTLPELLFWPACDALLEQIQALQSGLKLSYQRLRMEALQAIEAALPGLKQRLLVQSYDDLLLQLERGLSGEQGSWLASQLRARYPAALIDEFQDTDPVQYASFSRIYAGSDLAVFLVGDPKQAIYSFRGADIFTYLSAKSAADAEYTLGTNWRSHPDLVSAVNRVFQGQVNPFLYESIPFHPVEAARTSERVLLTESETAPLHIMWVESDDAMTKGVMRDLVANDTAEQIAHLLLQAQMGKATLLNSETQQYEALTGGDIAVLVRTAKQGRQIQQYLQQRGINSVQQGQDNVFVSAEAVLLHHILKAVVEPDNSGYIMAALASELWPYDMVELYDLSQDELAWSSLCDVFYHTHQTWLKRGFIRAFRQLMQEIKGPQQLLRLPNGERRLTNLLHLVELVQIQSRQGDGSMSAVINWYQKRMQSIDPNDETGQLRLESDEQLVKIITIHKSKGLEYPIVFCPYLWDVSLRATQQEVMTFHDAAEGNQAMVALSEPHLEQAISHVSLEERAEDLRLLYVALTRARERCIIHWGNVKGRAADQHVDQSALFHLLHPHLNEADSEAMWSDLTTLAAEQSEAISVSSVTDKAGEVIRSIADTPLVTLTEKPFDGEIQTPWRIGSFSALAHGHDAEMPDYDAQTDKLYLTETRTELPILNRFAFPKGAQAGTCLHTIFELWDFQNDDPVEMAQLVEKVLLQYGFESLWTPIVCDWLQAVLHTQLDPVTGLQLKDLTTTHRLDELAFYFPVTYLSASDLRQVLLAELPDNSPLASVVSTLRCNDLTGFMKGFIDLVFEYQGRFYIVDYKSNYLGQRREQYDETSLDQAMINHDYPLQYLIYSLALHRYLRLRLPDYDPDHHLGGVYYLFIRGMQPDWGQAGIFYDKPSTSLLMAFDHYMAGLEHE